MVVKKTLATAFASALTAVFPDVTREHSKGGVIGPVENESSLVPRSDKPRRCKALEMVTERRPRNVELRLNVTDHSSLDVTLHDAAKDRKAHGASQRCELFRVTFEASWAGHHHFYNIRNDCVKDPLRNKT